MSDLDLLLRMLPWLAVNPATTVDDVAATFGISTKKVVDLLEMVRWSGFGEMYGEMVDIEIFEDGDISVRDTLGLDRPLRLNAVQAAAIMSGLEYLAEVGTVADTSLVGGLMAKLRSVLPLETPVVSVVPGTRQREITALLREAISHHTQVLITYASGGAHNDPERVIEPLRLEASEDLVYVDAWCHAAHALRAFRVDRIVDAVALGSPAVRGLTAADVDAHRNSWPVVDMTVTMDHVGDFAPHTIVERRDDGVLVWLRARVATVEWLAGVLLAAGGNIVVHNCPEVYDVARAMVRRWQDASIS